MNNSNVIGIDLAKNVMQVCKISKQGELLSNKAVSPNKLKVHIRTHLDHPFASKLITESQLS